MTIYCADVLFVGLRWSFLVRRRWVLNTIIELTKVVEGPDLFVRQDRYSIVRLILNDTIIELTKVVEGPDLFVRQDRYSIVRLILNDTIIELTKVVEGPDLFVRQDRCGLCKCISTGEGPGTKLLDINLP